MENETPLDVLFDEVLQDFDAAIQAKDGWAWNDIEVATKLHDASTRSRHWKRSIESLVVDSPDSRSNRFAGDAGAEAGFRQFLRSIDSEAPSLSALIRTSLDDIKSTLESIHDLKDELGKRSE
jgi:hypothetical protein